MRLWTARRPGDERAGRRQEFDAPEAAGAAGVEDDPPDDAFESDVDDEEPLEPLLALEELDDERRVESLRESVR